MVNRESESCFIGIGPFATVAIQNTPFTKHTIKPAKNKGTRVARPQKLP